MIVVMFPHGVMQPTGSEIRTHTRDFARLVFDHAQLILFVLLLLFLTTAAASIGLRKRLRWARNAFIALMGVGIVWNVTSIVLTYYFLPLMSDALSSPVLQWPFNILSNILYVFSFMLSIGCIGLFWWIAARLVSEDARREFR